MIAEGEEAGANHAPAGRRPRSAHLNRWEWLLLLVLAVIQFTNMMDFMIVLPLGPQYMRELGISPRQFGFLVSVYGFSASLAGILAAWSLDRFDRKTAVLFLYAGFTLSTLLCAVAPSYHSLVLARTVAGGFGGVLGAMVLAIVGDAFPDGKRGTAMGVVMSAFSVASIAGVPAGLFLAQHLGWRAPFAVLGVASLVVWLGARAVLPPLRSHLVEGRGRTVNPWMVLTRPTHLRAYVLMLSLVMSTFMVIPYIAAYMVANVGRSEDELPYLYLCGGIATLLTLTPVGRLADRFGKLRIFRSLALLSVLPTLWLTNLPPVPLALALTASTLFMVITAGRMVPVMALITASALRRVRGSFMSINASVQHLAAGLAALTAGSILDKEPDGRLTGFTLIGILSATSMVLSVVLAGRLRPAVESAEDEPAEDPVTPDSAIALPRPRATPQREIVH